NVVLNAMDAMPRGGSLTIRRRYVGNQVELTFADTGSGIDPGNLTRIFQPFFRTKPTGTGLGMGISRTIVESFGGTIAVVCSPGQGTTFTVRLSAMK
ncbi:MAG: two-component sensor histidine kinase, partial [Candidatus Sericytochromatia bacterium]|nr:two-component sensor histidine kinase [Candidatus Sericytochromatia bacterium]